MESNKTGRGEPLWRDGRVVALLMAASLTTMANATISPALPGLARLFADDPNVALLVRLLVSAPSLSVAVCAPLVGLAVDRLGRRRLLLSGVLLFAFAGAAGLVLPDLPSIFVSRIILGVAVALIMTTQTALVGDYFAGADRSALTGLQTSARNFGGLVFISIAGCLAAVSPRWPFAVYGLAAAFLPVIWRAISEPQRIIAAPSTAQKVDASDSPNWALLLALVALLQASTNMIFFVLPTQIAFFLEAEGHGGAVAAGLVLACLMLSGGSLALLYPQLRMRVSSACIFGLGYAAMALGFMALGLSSKTAVCFVAASAIGAGYALVTPGFIALTLDLAPARFRGLSGGALTSSIFIGQFVSPLIATPLVAEFGYRAVFCSAGLLLVAMSALVVPLRRTALS